MAELTSEIRSKVTELGRVAKPLGQVRSKQIATSLAHAMFEAVRLGAEPSVVLKVYELKITSEVETLKSDVEKAPKTRLAEVLEHFNPDHHYATSSR